MREINSLLLTQLDESFDLIWIDGAHGYPIVSMDVINSYRLGSQSAFVLIDDIWKDASESDKMYKSVGGFESLNALVEAGLIDSFSLFEKRLRGQFNFPGAKKFVGLFVKSSS